MSDFFSGIQNAKFPDVVMNQGPLPPTTGLPAPLHESADGRINAASSLLGNLTPYAYGEPGYQSSQVSYVNHPHRIQKIIPELRLPRGIKYAKDDFAVSHAVDDSDIAFVLRLNRNSTTCSLLKNPCISRYNLGTAIDPFINLATLNYLLAGFQLCTEDLSLNENNLWKSLLHDLSQDYFKTVLRNGQNNNDRTTNISFEDLVYIVRELITPFGVVRGSEKQGGQHEMTNSPVTWPVNFVATMVIDGKERNVLNYWHNKEVAAGDDVCFRLKVMPIPEYGYTLNHYYKSVSRQDFKSLNRGLNQCDVSHVWQLVPDIFDLAAPADPFDRTIIMANPSLQLPIGNPNDPYRWQEWGFWHIGRTQVHAPKCSVAGDYYNDDMAMNLRIGHMDMTFTPCWQKVPGRPLLKRKFVAPVAPADEYHPKSALNAFMKPSSGTKFLDSLFEEPRGDDGYDFNSSTDANTYNNSQSSFSNNNSMEYNNHRQPPLSPPPPPPQQQQQQTKTPISSLLENNQEFRSVFDEEPKEKERIPLSSLFDKPTLPTADKLKRKNPPSGSSSGIAVGKSNKKVTISSNAKV
jgi:hypothetical protein